MATTQAPTQPKTTSPELQQQVIAALSAVLAANLSQAALSAAVSKFLAPLRVGEKAAKAALALSLIAGRRRPGPVTAELVGPATRALRAGEATTRAAYLAASSRRIEDALKLGEPLRDVIARESNHLRQHRASLTARDRAGASVDRMAELHGPVLGWKAVLDERTTPECRAAHGSNFAVSRPPVIGYPGMPHGGTCRCRPTAPWRGANGVDEAVRRAVLPSHLPNPPSSRNSPVSNQPPLAPTLR